MRSTLKRRALAAAAALSLLVPLALATSSPAGATVTTVTASADAFVASDLPTTNENTTLLSIDNSPLRYAFTKFVVTVPAGETVTNATLRCWAGSANSSGAGWWTTSSGWSETTLTWNNAPMPNFGLPASGSTGAVVAGAYNDANVTSAITGSGTYTFVGKTASATQWSCYSKEHTSNHPMQLVVTSSAPADSPPVARLTVTPASGDFPLAVTADASASTDTDATPISTYTFAWGDGTANTGPQAVATAPHTYTAAGTYTVTVTVTDTAGKTGTTTQTVTVTAPATHSNTTLPARGAFYYPWYPETWGNINSPDTKYTPTLGFYDSSAVMASHVASLAYGNFAFAPASWWGQGSATDGRLQPLLTAAHGTSVKFASYYEAEGNAVAGVPGSPNPAAAQITADLNYIASHYVQDPNYMWIADKPVIFAFGDAADGCAMNDRWAAGNAAATTHFYVVLKVFGGYAACTNQPDNWHQYGPASRVDQQGTHSYSLSPGYFKYTDPSPLLARDPANWPAAVDAMNCATADLKVVTTFNEWGEGTAVESASGGNGWASASGQGSYLDALHNDTTCGTLPPPGSVVVTAAGDIACETALAEGTTSCGENLTGNLIRSIAPDAALTLGDNQYNAGQLAEFNGSYDPAWGSFKPTTFPVAGNHDWGTPSANGYRQYYGARVPQDGTYWYSYNVGAWHFLALDSDCAKFTSCAAGSAEYQFVVNDLAANNGKPTIAYWHHPRWSSGTQHGSDPIMGPIFNLLVADHDVSIQLSGHEHNYERNARLDAAGVPDPTGVMVWTVGSGGKNHYCGVTNPRRAGSAVFNCDTFGVLKLTLRSDGSFDYAFVNAPGTGTFTDSGTVAKRP